MGAQLPLRTMVITSLAVSAVEKLDCVRCREADLTYSTLQKARTSGSRIHLEDCLQ